MNTKSLRDISFDYFNEQVGYQLSMSGKIKNKVKQMWLEGEGIGQIVKEFINSELMTESVKRCKTFIDNQVDIDIDSKGITMQIIYGFIDYLQKIHTELEETVNKPQDE